jgi:phospholipase/carboxylesterase
MLEYGSRTGTLRTRWGTPPRTALAYPHEQLTQGGPAALRARLYERARALPGVVEAPVRVSMPTETRSFVFEPEYAQGPPEAFLTGGEFSHLHPDGSLHVALPHGLGDEVVGRGWGEVHSSPPTPPGG